MGKTIKIYKNEIRKKLTELKNEIKNIDIFVRMHLNLTGEEITKMEILSLTNGLKNISWEINKFKNDTGIE